MRVRKKPQQAFSKEFGEICEVRWIYADRRDSTKWLIGIDDGKFITHESLDDLEIVDAGISDLEVVIDDTQAQPLTFFDPIFVHDKALLVRVMEQESGAYEEYCRRKSVESSHDAADQSDQSVDGTGV